MLKFIDLFPELLSDLHLYKVHMATGSNQNNPLHVFFRGDFKHWQEWQTKRNFERPNILSLIYYTPNEWLFAGIYRSLSCIQRRENHFEYQTELLEFRKELIGRLIIKFNKVFRASYLLLESHYDQFIVSEILKEKLSILPFPGYEKVNINFDYLKTIVKNEELSWKTALLNIKGVYLISDRNSGKLYVGSVYGQEAFWTRWSQYINSGHGNNVDLKQVILDNGIEYAEHFSFSILEIRSSITDDLEIIQREAYWKEILLTRKFGYNKN